MQIGERTVIKTMARMTEWRLTIQAAESKRLRKTILDMWVALFNTRTYSDLVLQERDPKTSFKADRMEFFLDFRTGTMASVGSSGMAVG